MNEQTRDEIRAQIEERKRQGATYARALWQYTSTLRPCNYYTEDHAVEFIIQYGYGVGQSHTLLVREWHGADQDKPVEVLRANCGGGGVWTVGVFTPGEWQERVINRASSERTLQGRERLMEGVIQADRSLLEEAERFGIEVSELQESEAA